MCVFLSRVSLAIRFCSSEEKLIEWDNENYYNGDYIYDLNFRLNEITLKGNINFEGSAKREVGGEWFSISWVNLAVIVELILLEKL